MLCGCSGLHIHKSARQHAGRNVSAERWCKGRCGLLHEAHKAVQLYFISKGK